jgi:hypothetical protein
MMTILIDLDRGHGGTVRNGPASERALRLTPAHAKVPRADVELFTGGDTYLQLYVPREAARRARASGKSESMRTIAHAPRGWPTPLGVGVILGRFRRRNRH